VSNVSLENPFEVFLAICFVVVAFAVLIGSFVVAAAYVYSNVFERWPEYSNKRRFQVSRNIVIVIAIVAVVLWLSANRL
jgi:FtsH-binding integral membrane protein